MLALAVASFLAPLFAGEPIIFNPVNRLIPPSEGFWFGTDNLGRNVFARTIYGGQVSLLVGFAVSVAASAAGLTAGLIAGYFRRLDPLIMRAMDGLMAIPAILLAIALMSLRQASIENVIFAITLAEFPRVVRLVRSLVLTLREQPFVEAAIASGSSDFKILVRHILPNTVAPMIVQATFIAASAIIIEASLSFLGAGTPPEIPSWGGTIAEGRGYFEIAPWIVFFPGAALGLLVLGVNMLGDGLRDLLDPRIARAIGR